MFNPGDLVMLSARALIEDINRGGKLFPDLTAESIMTVKEQRNHSVYIDTKSNFHGVIHETWLVPAFVEQESSELGSDDAD